MLHLPPFPILGGFVQGSGICSKHWRLFPQSRSNEKNMMIQTNNKDNHLHQNVYLVAFQTKRRKPVSVLKDQIEHAFGMKKKQLQLELFLESWWWFRWDLQKTVGLSWTMMNQKTYWSCSLSLLLLLLLLLALKLRDNQFVVFLCFVLMCCFVWRGLLFPKIRMAPTSLPFKVWLKEDSRGAHMVQIVSIWLFCASTFKGMPIFHPKGWCFWHSFSSTAS